MPSPMQPLTPYSDGATPLSSWASYSVFLFFAFMLGTPRGYALGAVLLIVGSFYYLARRPAISLTRDDKIMVALMLSVFVVGAISWRYHGNDLQSLDLPSRYLLAIPIFLLMLAHPVKLSWLNAGFIVGGIAAGTVAAWERYSLGAERAAGFTGGIQFGDLALMMAVFCVAAFVASDWLFRKPALWRAASLLGIAGGSYASIMSGARGGWVAIPFVVLVFCAAYLRRSNVKWIVATLLGLLAVSVIAVSTVPMVESRYERAIEDVQMYRQGDTESSLGARFEVWRALTVIIPQKPYMGWSEAGYKSEKERLVASGAFTTSVTKLANTHNTFLEVWVLQGLLGLMPVLALLALSLVYFGRRLRSADPVAQYLAVCGVSLVGCFVIFSQTQIMLGRNNTLLFFIISLITFWGALRCHIKTQLIHNPHAL